MSDILTDVRFWEQIVGDSERTIVCHPELESRIKTRVDALGLSEIFTVTASPYCPENMAYVIDEQAISATLAQSFTRGLDLPDPPSWMGWMGWRGGPWSGWETS